MSLRGSSVLTLSCLLGLAACSFTSPQEPPTPSATPPSEEPSTGSPGTGNPPPSPPPPGERACSPRSCEHVRAHCGALPDGCGGTLHCDACPSGQRCGEDRLPDLCVAPDGAPSTAWVKTFPRRVTALATDSKANIAFFTDTLEGDAPSLLDPAGQLLWARPGVAPRVSFYGLSVAPSGALLAWGSRYGESGPGGAVAYRFDALGQQPTLFDWCGDECGLGPYGQDTAGNQLVISGSSQGSRIGYSEPDGEGWSLIHSFHEGPFPPDYPQTPFAYSSAVLDPQGDVLVAGALDGQGTFQGRSFGVAQQPTLVVMKLSPRGQLVWARELPNTRAGLRHLQASGSGNVVGLGTYWGSLSWPGGELRSPGPYHSESFLMALDARGNLSWAQSVPLDARALAVSASGSIAVASAFDEPLTDARASLHLRVYDAQGHLLWSRTWSPLDSTGSLSLSGMAWAGEELVLGGAFRGAVDFGTGVQQAPTQSYPSAGFLLKLQRP